MNSPLKVSPFDLGLLTFQGLCIPCNNLPPPEDGKQWIRVPDRPAFPWDPNAFKLHRPQQVLQGYATSGYRAVELTKDRFKKGSVPEVVRLTIIENPAMLAGPIRLEAGKIMYVFFIDDLLEEIKANADGKHERHMMGFKHHEDGSITSCSRALGDPFPDTCCIIVRA